MLKITNVKLGADPELFVKDKATDTFIPAIDMLGGNKEFPREIEAGFSVQEDNVLAEFTIPPSDNKDTFIANVLKGIDITRNNFLFDGLDVEVRTSYKFPKELLIDPRAYVFGCDPDFNAWEEGRENKKPHIPKDGLRTAGGHIHVGYDLDQKNILGKVNHSIIQFMDLYLGVPSILMDGDTDRRRLYGKAGAYRSKPYGVEYRTLSSFWVADPKLIGWAFEQTMRAVEAVKNLEVIDKSLGTAIQSAINFQDKDICESLISKYSLKIA